MNEQDKITLDLIKAEAVALPELDRIKLEACVAQLQNLVRFYGPLGYLALAQVGAEAGAGVL